MSKSEVLAKLKETGSITRFHRDTAGLWDKAFKLYNESHPNDKKNQNCGHCYRVVSAWLHA